ncbi:MAG TPA: dTMP kinase [Tissierellales bacterium]|nr:dTMP kinase [Tissierellales bacterium]
MRGIFITLEGPDGSGKSTISRNIANYLSEENIDFITTREPGGTKIGEDIRDIILDSNNKKMCPETEALLYAASRGQHVQEKILPSLNKGKVILCERYLFSSLAYQGVGRNLGIEEVKKINDFAIKNVYPDLVLFLDVDPMEVLKRKTKRNGGDRLEREGNNFHLKVYRGYKKLIKMYPENLKIINASKSIEETSKKSIEYVKKILEEGGILS